MKKCFFPSLLILLMNFFGVNAFAHHLAVANNDGVIVFYNFINNRTELAVTYGGRGHGKNSYFS